jgi:hypothetical protein
MTDPATPQEPVVTDNLEPTEPVEPTEPIEPTEPAEPTEYMTPEQVAEAVSRGTQDMKTWMGRRDKELFGQIGGMIDERIPKQVQPPDEVSTELLNDPVSTVRKIMSEATTEKDRNSQRHNSDVFTHIGNAMDSDPLYQDKELGDDLVAEIKAQFQAGKIDASLSPESAAKVLQANALSNVMRNRQGKNGLSKNQPGAPAGALQPGPPSLKPKLKVPDLPAELMKLARDWGYSNEALAKLYGTDS